MKSLSKLPYHSESGDQISSSSSSSSSLPAVGEGCLCDPKASLLNRLQSQLDTRQREGTLRSLLQPSSSKHNKNKPNSCNIDFCSNDYLGLARCPVQFSKVNSKFHHYFHPFTHPSQSHQQHQQHDNGKKHEQSTLGATGSRLLSGNKSYPLQLEQKLAQYHNRTSALLFNSGYDANLSLLSSIPLRGDVVIMDSLVHNSLIMGVRMGRVRQRVDATEVNESNVGSDVMLFEHNSVDDLRRLLINVRNRWKQQNRIDRTKNQKETYKNIKTITTAMSNKQIFIVVESVYSMDGDIAPLKEILDLAMKYEASVIVDEAHGLGIYGKTNASNLILPEEQLGQQELQQQYQSSSHGKYNHLRSAAINGAFHHKGITKTPKSASPQRNTERIKGGTGVIAALNLELHPALLATVQTFGKAAGCHGAVVTTSSPTVIDYLVNYARPFIYSTALPPHSLVSIECSYDTMVTSMEGEVRRKWVFHLVKLFRLEMLRLLEDYVTIVENEDFAVVGKLAATTGANSITDVAAPTTTTKLNPFSSKLLLLPSPSPIQAVLCPGNETCLQLSNELRSAGSFDIYPIRSPTVPKGLERIRIILHFHNTEKEVRSLVEHLVRTMHVLEIIQFCGNRRYCRLGNESPILSKL